MRATVLLVDDDALIRSIGVALLDALGYQAQAVDCGAAALAVQERPDVVLLDDNLPDGTGVEFLRHLRGRWPMLPIVLCSGTIRLNAEALAEAGWSGALPKPYRVSAIEAVLAQVLNG